MGCFKRAVSSITHNKKRFILILIIILIVSVLLQVSYQIRVTAAESVEQIRKSIGVSVTTRLKDKDLISTDKSSYYPYELAQKIGSLSEIKESKYLCMVNVWGEDIKGATSGMTSPEEYERMYPGIGDFQLIGITDMQTYWNFKKGTDNMKSGRMIEPDDVEAVAVISDSIMSSYNLSLGDAITVSSNFDRNKVVTLEIVGTHSGEQYYGTPDYLGSINFIYVPLNVAIGLSGTGGVMETEYILKDPTQLETFLNKAQSISEANNLDLVFIKNNLNFLLASTALNGLIKTCDAIFITVIALSAIILSLLVIYLMNERLFEIGILLSLGENRFKISLQMILEILMPTLIAINIGALLSSIIIPAVGKAVAAGMQIDQPLTSANVGELFLLANICGILLVIFASIIPTVAIRKYTPKQIMQTFV